MTAPFAARRAPIVLVDPSRQIQILGTDDALQPQTAGGDPSLVWGWWSPDRQALPTYAWPGLSPDGTRIACFATDADGASQIVVIDVGGVGSAAIADLDRALPIYLFWSPDGRRVGYLAQRAAPAADRLVLGVADAADPDSARELADGSPLFFTWTGDEIAAFVGDPEGSTSRLAVFPADAARPERALAGQPGNFCAPVPFGDQVLYVTQHGPIATVLLAPADGVGEARAIESLRGLVALVASPDGARMARAVAPGGDGSPYRDLAVIDVATGRVTPVSDEPCLAFFWTPDGRALLTARVDTERNLIAWTRVSLDGRPTPLVDMYPTRDFGFYLRFFEQYSQSHPIVEPGGDRLLLAGGLLGHGDPHGPPGLFEVDVATGASRRVADGVFGAYGPPPR